MGARTLLLGWWALGPRRLTHSPGSPGTTQEAVAMKDIHSVAYWVAKAREANSWAIYRKGDHRMYHDRRDSCMRKARILAGKA